MRLIVVSIMVTLLSGCGSKAFTPHPAKTTSQ